MKKIIMILSVLIATAVCAAPQTYLIEGKFLIEGELISSPQIIAQEGESAEVEVGSEDGEVMKMGVFASEASNEQIKDGILMKFNLAYKNDETKFKSSPQLLVKSGAESAIQILDESGKETMTFKVKAVRQ